MFDYLLSYENEISYSRQRFNLFWVVLSIIIAVTPELNRNLPKSLWVGVILMWYLDFFLLRKSEYFKAFNFTVLLFVWFIVELLFRIIGFSTAEFGNYFIILAFYDVLIKSFFCAQFYSDERKIKLIRFIQIIILANVLMNIYMGMTMDNVHFLIYYYPEQYIGKNIAMTEFYNMLAFYGGFCVFDFLKQKKSIMRVFDILCVVVSLFFMVRFEPRSTALTLFLLLVIGAFFCNTKSAKLRTMEIVLMCMLAIVAFMSFDGIVSILSRFLPERISLRLVAISTASGGSEYLERFSLMKNSINTFISTPSNFLFGIGFHLGEKYISMVGQHSLITNYMAWYGCVGIAVLFNIFNGIRKNLYRVCFNNYNYRYCKYVMIIFLFASVVQYTFRAETAISALMLTALSASIYQED